MQDIINLPDSEIIERTKILCAKERLITAKLLLYIAAFDDRRLYAKKAYPSMFQYLVSEMKYSEGSASRRLTSARLTKRYPALYPMVEEGALHLSALHKLSNYADRSDFMEIVKRAKGRSRRSLEELLAQITGEVPVQKESVRVYAVKKKVVKPRVQTEPTPPASPAASEPAKTESQEPQVETAFELNARISVAIDAETYADLMRAKEILGHTALADVLKDALKVLLDKKDPKRKAERMATAAAARCSEKSEITEEAKRPAASNPRAPSAQVKRAVYQRDGWQCVYVDPNTGKRCCATTNLHLDHRIPYAAGGATTEDNLRVLCFQHNRLAAEEWFGREKIDKEIRSTKSSRVERNVSQ